MTTSTTQTKPDGQTPPAPPSADDKPSKAIAEYDPGAGTQGVLIGGHLAAFQEFARVIAISDLLPDGLKGKPQNVLMALMQGLDLGLRPMQALNLIDVIKGKPAMSAQGMRAQILAAGHRFRIVEHTDTKCTVAAHRSDWADDEWPEVSFTIEQAKQAGLAGGDNWKKYPADMLLARATTRMAKAYFSDVTNGLNSVEELLDITPSSGPRPSLGEVAAQRDAQPAEEPGQPPAETGADGQPIQDAELVDDDAADEAVRQNVLAEAARSQASAEAEQTAVSPDVQAQADADVLAYDEIAIEEERSGGGN